MKLEMPTPEWAEPLLEPSRYKGVHGGRGSGKSHFFAELLLEEHLRNPAQRSVCIREVQQSIKMSVKQLLEDKIRKFSLEQYFLVQDAVIKNKRGEGLIVFQGMQSHTADSIKSLEGFDRAWFEEAQRASQRSLDLLRPTMRKPGSELWFSWNPDKETDPIDVLLRGDEAPEDSIILQVNYMDNPWFPDVLRKEMEYDRRRDPEKYQHVWMGGYNRNSEARVFKNWKVKEFETHPDAHFRFGADWGFAVDPTVLIRCYMEGRKLYVDYEAYEVGCEIIDIPELFLQVPDCEDWPIVADSARPETISHVRKHGFPKIIEAIKGKGSVEDGVEFLKTYDIIVHPRCRHTIDELTNYSYKIDKETDMVTSVLEDKHNHVIDALRYACEGARRLSKRKTVRRPRAESNYDVWGT